MKATRYNLNKILEQYDFKSDKKLQELLQIQQDISSEDILGLTETYKLEDIILKLCAIENIQRLKVKVYDTALSGASQLIKRLEKHTVEQKDTIEKLEKTVKLANVLLQYNTLRTNKLKSLIKALAFALAFTVGFALVLVFKAFL